MAPLLLFMMIYLDFHATSPVLPEVWEAMRPYALEAFGNPSSSHQAGRRARQAVDDAREQIATLLGASPEELIFTSGATEANNLAIFGFAGTDPCHLIGSMIEHPCVVEPLRLLEGRGFAVDWLLAREGRILAEDIAEHLSSRTRLICLMTVNHETGGFQPVREAAQRFSEVAIHTDAAQAVGKLPINFRDLGVASLCFSGHKFGAPKGIGGLLVRRGRSVPPMLFGGHQQKGRRPGTEPVALVAGLAKALEIALQAMTQRLERISRLRTLFVEQLERACSPVAINSPADGSPYVVNVSFSGCTGPLLLAKLDLAGIACSTGSACSSGSLLPSPVLDAMGLQGERLGSAMRFSFGFTTTEDEILTSVRVIAKCVSAMRSSAGPPL